MHHVELVLSPASDRAVRALWQALAEAGLPSLLDHRGASNRPHVTLTVVEDWPASLPETPVLPLPMTAVLGPPALFGGSRLTLVRALVVSEPLLALRRAVVDGLGPPASRFYEDTRWVPHLTLAQRLGAQEVGRALEVVAGRGPEQVELAALRHWDAQARLEEPFPQR